MMITSSAPAPAPGPEEPAFAAEVAHLKENPGEWFTVRTAPTRAAAWSMAAAIRQGKKVAFRPANEFEVYTHDTQVNARYVGPGAAENE